jgi:hypothetical protein
LSAPEELHQFAWNYTWEDGVAPLAWLIHHPSCDRGTALLVFWHAYPRCNWRKGETPGLLNLFNHLRDADDLPDFDTEVFNLIKEIRARYTSGVYALATICYDPQDDGGMDLTKDYRTLTAQFRIPSVMYRRTPGRLIARATF